MNVRQFVLGYEVISNHFKVFLHVFVVIFASSLKELTCRTGIRKEEFRFYFTVMLAEVCILGGMS